MENKKRGIITRIKDEEIKQLVEIYKGLDEPSRRIWVSGGSLLCASIAAREVNIQRE